MAIPWGRYFRSDATLPRWWIEHCRWHRIAVAWVLTLLAAACGRPLFQRLRLEHPIRWARLLVALLLSAIVVAAALVGTVAWAAVSSILRQPAISTPTVHARELTQFPGGSRFVWAAVRAEPVSFLERLRAVGHVLCNPTQQQSTPIYSHALILDPAGVAKAEQAWAEERAAESVPRVRVRLRVVAFSPSPAALWARGVPELRAPVCFSIVACLATLSAFVVLPIARRRAKVRAAQLLRCGAYLAIAGCPSLVALTLFTRRLAVPPWWPRDTLLSGTARDLMVVLPAAVLLGIWWHAASGRYLRMARPAAVAASVATLGTLLAWVVDLA